MNNKVKIPIIIISIIIVIIAFVSMYNQTSNTSVEKSSDSTFNVNMGELSNITVTGTISHWQPIDGPAYAITPENNLTIPLDDGRIYLYGNLLNSNLDGKQVSVTGKITENYAEYQLAKNGGALGGDPTTSVIFVTEISLDEMPSSICAFDPENPDTECNDAFESSVKTTILYIDSKLVDCVGVGPQQCMLVKEDLDSEWEMFYNFIEGFEYQEGTEYKISVTITDIENPPADASSLKYDLVKILKKTQVTQDIADLVFTNGIVYTVDKNNLDAEAVAIDDGIISFVGTNDDVQNYIGENTNVVDLEGKLMLPGIHDVHLHILEASSSFGGDCILDDSDPEEFVSYFQECSSEQTKRDWLVGWGHSILSLEASQRTPLEIIDEAIPDRPAIMLEQTSHSAWANSIALKLAGFDDDSPDPPSGILGRDSETGALNGILYENAGEIVMDLALTRTPEIDESNYQGLLFGLELLAENGITSITDAKVNLDRGFDDIWKRADVEDTLTVRAVMGIWTHPQHDDDYQIDRIKSLYSNDPDSLLKFTQVKMYSDGLLDSGTAKLVEAYLDDIGYGDDGKGINYFDEERITHYITELEKVGFDFHIHALGDGAVRESLNAIESAQNTNGNSDTRHRLTHLELVHSDDINRFEELGVIADFQVAGDWTLPENNDYLEEVIGEQRLADQIPVRSVYDTGAVITLSSDYDVSSISPFVGMQHALSRGHQSMPDLESVIESYTINGAYLMRQEDKTGSIEIGKFADLIIVDQNIFDVSIDKIGDTKVLFTYLEGQQIFP